MKNKLMSPATRGKHPEREINYLLRLGYSRAAIEMMGYNFQDNTYTEPTKQETKKQKHK